jgi:hypothetical protein
LLAHVVTFWHGPLDALRQACLRSQLAMGHKVTVFSFGPIPGLPPGVDNAEAEAILPYSFSERLRPAESDGSWRDWTTVQFSDFFRVRLMAERAGLWLDADVLLLRPVEIDPEKPYLAWERPRRVGNSVLYLPPNDPIIAAFDSLMRQKELTPDWLSLRHRLAFALRRSRGQHSRLSDLRASIFGPASMSALVRRFGQREFVRPKKTFHAVHHRPNRFFEPSDFTTLICDPEVIGLHISPRARCKQKPIPGSLHAWAVEHFGA